MSGRSTRSGALGSSSRGRGRGRGGSSAGRGPGAAPAAAPAPAPATSSPAAAPAPVAAPAAAAAAAAAAAPAPAAPPASPPPPVAPLQPNLATATVVASSTPLADLPCMAVLGLAGSEPRVHGDRVFFPSGEALVTKVAPLPGVPSYFQAVDTAMDIERGTGDASSLFRKALARSGVAECLMNPLLTTALISLRNETGQEDWYSFKPHVDAIIAKCVTLGLMTERSMLDDFVYRGNDLLLQFGVSKKVLRIFTDLLPNARNISRETTLRDRNRLKAINKISGGGKLAATLATAHLSGYAGAYQQVASQASTIAAGNTAPLALVGGGPLTLPLPNLATQHTFSSRGKGRSKARAAGGGSSSGPPAPVSA
ncbi:unnamed protein product, partial [Ectocarpus sp. 4 AP-2014]